MTPEKPEADAVEQDREDEPRTDAPEDSAQQIRHDVDPADLAEQERVVPDDEDGYDY